ncbi:hypothetical protein CBF34_01610 [Vagococcus penaei]|uniref:Carbonic anhydrase n=1 Tax=Vagococcus penaei TaxID=633807 RepID=A0A1Q2D7Y7_9ENTE|nr:carbonic anhydrase family protein [Vagococcus penaei]AQP54489.1 hypothetical protein BW732_09925 [Vagococcus penaei]RSU06802.1 hypothetical protein CBF34_01610 [Vagococcus penaei]
MKRLNQDLEWNYHEQHDWCFHTEMSQSPINIDDSLAEVMEDAGDIILNYETTIDEMVDTGFAIQGNVKGTARINGRLFHLQQFHFHAHSEHTINDQYYPLELHFVHQAQNGKNAVIGILFDIGEENPVFEQIITLMITKKQANQPIYLERLLPKNRRFYHYLGSLTTPPLTENVEWYVMPEVVSISHRQLSEITKWYDHNHRKRQPLYGRHILKKEFES